MKTATHRDLGTGVTTVRLIGELSRENLPAVHTAVVKAAAECPAAVLVDLTSLHWASTGHPAVFATATHQARVHWSVPVLLCGAEPWLVRGLAAYRSFVALYEDRLQALTALRAYVPRWMRRHLGPVLGSAAEAREMLGEACLMWDVGHLADNARLVASELASNAILHARTEFDITASFTGQFVRIAVRDGCHAMPRVVEAAPGSSIIRAGSGRGMRLVTAASTHWGATRLRDGKIVWALIKAARSSPG
ncbi:hypothetical protein Ade02nite_14850 [Paractinoplanes deccanensis]|uniref:STAS domain-containing protein n=1 Tax=Paractinoplanes deccanensis TaxID=113561 RepID=A0ABQ3XYL4_9ACTN|nr:ATP-binding protein [Actinoplanes deccanensis]GID72844.1 hypothetical protein Ade02nite_14850 [Actinoplanes deccanensis]